MLYSSIAVNFSLVLDMLLLLLFFSTIHQNNVLAKVGDVVEVAEHEQHIFGCTTSIFERSAQDQKGKEAIISIALSCVVPTDRQKIPSSHRIVYLISLHMPLPSDGRQAIGQR